MRDRRCDFTACCKLGHFERVNEVRWGGVVFMYEYWSCFGLSLTHRPKVQSNNPFSVPASQQELLPPRPATRPVLAPNTPPPAAVTLIVPTKGLTLSPFLTSYAASYRGHVDIVDMLISAGQHRHPLLPISSLSSQSFSPYVAMRLLLPIDVFFVFWNPSAAVSSANAAQ
jgi:hypothetical protein